MIDELRLVPVKFDDACGFVAMWHRHHQPPTGHKFSVGVAAGETLVGVVMVGRPVARAFDDGSTLEVIRSATDGTPNVNSMLYAAAWRAASALGYRRLVTYTQEGESGSSLRAAGWRVVAERSRAARLVSPESPPHGQGRGPHRPHTLGGVVNDDESMRQARLLMAMMDSGKARIEPTDPDDGIGVAWIRVHDAIVVAVETLAAALARAEAAEEACAELHDALDAMRMTADEVQARQRGRVQAGAWAQAAAAVQQATNRSSA